MEENEKRIRIKAIEIVLNSFADFRKKSEEERQDFLESQFPNNKYLKTYFTYSSERLQEALNKLLPPTTVFPSPRFERSVFVLCDSVARGQGPIETCFVISKRHLLTCYHNLLEDQLGNPEQNYTIALSVERSKTNEGYRQVRLRYRNKSVDWAILELLDDSSFPEIIPVSLDLSPVPSDTYVKVLHCAVGPFNDEEEEILSADTAWAKTMRGTAHHRRCNRGFYRGSSGAPVVLRNGSVVAFHQESNNEARKLPSGQTLAQMTADETWDLVSDVVNSVASSYSANARAIEISKCPCLVQKLRDLGLIPSI